MRRRISGLNNQVFGDGIRLIFALPLFVLNHTALQVEHFLVDGVVEETHAVRLGEKRVIERRYRHVFKIISSVLAGGPIEVCCANALHRFDVAARQMFAAAEHQMFKKVGETGLTGAFIFGADVIPDIKRHDGRLAVLMNYDRETVIENKMFAGYF